MTDELQVVEENDFLEDCAGWFDSAEINPIIIKCGCGDSLVLMGITAFNELTQDAIKGVGT